MGRVGDTTPVAGFVWVLPEAELERLWQRLQPLAIHKMPLTEPPPRRSRFGSPLVLSRVHWARPEMLVEVRYVEWTPDGCSGILSIWGITTGVCHGGFVVCDRGSSGSCFCNARRLQSISSKSIMAGRRSFISRSTSHVSAGI